MAYGEQQSRYDRLKSIAAVTLIHAGIGYGLVSGMGVDIALSTGDSLNVINIMPPSPEPEPAPVQAKAETEQGAASPKNLKSKATPVVAPKPKVIVPKINPVIAAPKAGEGNQASAGASNERGPGSGSGGLGDGTGSGRSGDGPGGGIASAPRHISGALTRRDIPREIWKSTTRGKLFVVFTVNANGRARGCRIKKSSGNAALDEITCRLIEERFLFEPARNRNGAAIAQPYGWVQEWWRDGRGPQFTR
ncbi:hypothetical protein MNBD_ALPHA04-2186 [hydrothermal vent metagenome]|uniref:TonB C-terminal domain-containing protein n=1 Tax=hydrothermal vent metagenome TaxID=652676 RepID=A0A3B0T1N6_9ZZZZ